MRERYLAFYVHHNKEKPVRNSIKSLVFIFGSQALDGSLGNQSMSIKCIFYDDDDLQPAFCSVSSGGLHLKCVGSYKQRDWYEIFLLLFTRVVHHQPPLPPGQTLPFQLTLPGHLVTLLFQKTTFTLFAHLWLVFLRPDFNCFLKFTCSLNLISSFYFPLASTNFHQISVMLTDSLYLMIISNKRDDLWLWIWAQAVDSRFKHKLTCHQSIQRTKEMKWEWWWRYQSWQIEEGEGCFPKQSKHGPNCI